MRLPDNESELESPDLTPVIDVVFLLLIFFLVATRFDQEERELDIILPEVADAQPVTMSPGLIINITREGKFKVVRQEYTEQQLVTVIREVKRNNPHQLALIRGDGDSALKYAARVMSICNSVDMDYRLATFLEL
jgi:biopolymer transport protein ExbD